MAEPGADDPRDPSESESAGEDRRRTIDLVRVERGEPERRQLPRFPGPRNGDEDKPPEPAL